MKVKILICGSSGKMGGELTRLIKQNKQFLISGLVNKKNYHNFIKKNISVNYEKIIKKTDVILDFSHPTLTLKILRIAHKYKKNVIIGTTGFNSKQENFIRLCSKKIAILKSGNMSIGVNILAYTLKILSKKIPDDYKIGIIDNHHKTKLDYPSGTALMLADALSIGRNKSRSSMMGKYFLNKKGYLNNNKINFFIIRKGKTIGKHSIFFKKKNESFELKHIAFSRNLFADGALRTAAWLNKKKKGLFNMQDMLNLN
jgi:4-hydroxy-tetrahydrodipicolinate reductase